VDIYCIYLQPLQRAAPAGATSTEFVRIASARTGAMGCHLLSDEMHLKALAIPYVFFTLYQEKSKSKTL